MVTTNGRLEGLPDEKRLNLDLRVHVSRLVGELRRIVEDASGLKQDVREILSSFRSQRQGLVSSATIFATVRQP